MRNSRTNHMTHVSWLIEDIMRQFLFQLVVIIEVLIKKNTRKQKCNDSIEPYAMLCKILDQIKHLSRMTSVSDTNNIVNLKMDRNTFGRLCNLFRQLGSLEDGRYVSVEEQVAMFLSILAHHKKNRVVWFDFWRSGQKISYYVHTVSKAILKLHVILLVKPDPVPEECDDPRWKWFKGCLGALDGTYINVLVSNSDKPRYKTRKGQIATNTLGVYDRNMKFVYALPGWEESAANSRILRYALNRPHRLRVPWD
ncbi:uncharacterized protein LOC131010366 [Salvia miltiorrhiza]|uniref:uncharacterized protein LOC131010366 n=1 Tax=Salvia miltiorrhiza TaxID=226208 RepID=UPI0025AD4134|nr:uncharacterized protein LOC131010366 [Salvia miltiorrhiza]XP_057793846.1 uncharacterized protein LOC131010366 [Salvia miltiorrhiza]